MLNKKVLLGTLVAGAMLLPLAASAGIVSGPCVNCHTMHATDGDGGNLAQQNAQLTRGNSCAGCHAQIGGTNDATGMYDNGDFSAPQVHDAAQPNLAGFFTVGGTDPLNSNQQHNVDGDIPNVVAENVIPNAEPPGNPAGAGYANAACGDCHVATAGAHHGTGAATTYRMLYTMTGTTVADDTYGNGAAGAFTADGTNVPDASATTYNATAMNQVCNGCHPDFHGYDTDVQQLNGAWGTNAAWIRHPTDLSLTDQRRTDANAYNYAANWAGSAVNADLVPLGTSTSGHNGTTGDADVLMCITCHYSHGGPYADLLRFDYTLQQANVGGETPGCESCHSYADGGM